MQGRSTQGAVHAGTPSPGTRHTSPGAVGPTTATLPHAPLGPAVVLLGATEAVIALRRDGRDEIVRVPRRDAPSAVPFPVRVCDAVGERAPVEVLGSSDDRLAFERELVLLSHRPDCIVEEPNVHDAHPEALYARLRGLRGHPG